MSFKFKKTLLYIGSVLASVVVFPMTSYAICPTNNVSSSISIRSSSSTYQFSSHNSESCEYIIIKRSHSEKEPEYYYDQDCDEDSPFGISGIIIRNRRHLPIRKYSLPENLLGNSISLFNLYSFGGSCVFSIYD